MKHIDSAFFRKLLSVRGAAFHYVPFPGKNPVRLYLAVGVRNVSGGIQNRFKYIGKWNLSAIRRAKKIWNNLDPVYRTNLVCEFCKTGILSTGSLSSLQGTRLRSLIFQRNRTLEYRNPGRAFIPDAVEYVPFRLMGKVFIMVDKEWLASESEIIIRRLCTTRYVLGLRGLNDDGE